MKKIMYSAIVIAFLTALYLFSTKQTNESRAVKLLYEIDATIDKNTVDSILNEMNALLKELEGEKFEYRGHLNYYVKYPEKCYERIEKYQHLSFSHNKALKKYGKKTYDKLDEGKFWVGMTDEMAKFALGTPKDVKKNVGSWGVHETWIYKNNLYLFFENGKLTSYQN